MIRKALQQRPWNFAGRTQTGHQRQLAEDHQSLVYIVQSAEAASAHHAKSPSYGMDGHRMGKTLAFVGEKEW